MSSRKAAMFCSVAALAVGINLTSWVAPLLVLPLNLLVLWTLKNAKFGNILSSVVGILLPLALLICTNHLFAERITATMFPLSPSRLFLILIMPLTFVLTLGGTRRAVRATHVFFWFIAGTLALMLLLSVSAINPTYLLPGVSRETFSLDNIGALGILIIFALGTFLRVDDPEKKNKSLLTFMVFTTFAVSLLALMSAGILGPNMVTRLNNPLFSAAKSLMIPGVMERVDAAVAALWLMADVTLMVFLFLTALQNLREVFGVRKNRLASLILHAVVFAGAWLIS
ncbi:hypothetical protein FACS18949_03540 [Clostridia bacterium]|nr:hypothetical protein FACS18949_03540 [Clostridia bacterium]